MAELMRNLKVVNAPAGSGKSHEIKERVSDWALSNPLDKLLCVTYTNRAADELRADISSPNVEISTIHSYLGQFSKAFFGAPEIVELYFEQYGETIKKRLINAEKRPHIDESNARYEEKLGSPLTFEKIVASVDKLYYNERPSTTYYRGGLSHDELLSFVALCARKYPAIYRRISSKYRQIVIDEYQDTNVDVLEFFVAAVEASSCELFLFGDPMQQIYKSEPVKFRGVMQNFEVEEREVINHRSSPEILVALNAVYNDKSLVQKASHGPTGRKPRVHFVNDRNAAEARIASDSTLVLSIHNSSIYQAIGATDLFKALQGLPEHSYNSRFTAVSVLSERDWENVPNPLIMVLYGLLTIQAEYDLLHYGNVIQMLRRHPREFGGVTLHSHDDKANLEKRLLKLFQIMNVRDVSIREVVVYLKDSETPRPFDFSEYLEDASYQDLLDIPFSQVRLAFEYRKNPTRSTQHGVKGESHEAVLFLAETSNRVPVVHISSLFDIWTRVDLSLAILERFQANLLVAFSDALGQIGADVNALKSDSYGAHEELIIIEARRILREFGEIPLFVELYKAPFERYLDRPNVTNAKALFKNGPIDGLLSAYRIFYVGCSRARNNLDVVIPFVELKDKEAAASKFRALGFDVLIDG